MPGYQLRIFLPFEVLNLTVFCREMAVMDHTGADFVLLDIYADIIPDIHSHDFRTKRPESV